MAVDNVLLNLNTTQYGVVDVSRPVSYNVGIHNCFIITY